MTEPEPNDSYIDDRIHEQLVKSRAIIADLHHEENGLWHWVDGDTWLRAVKDPLIGQAHPASFLRWLGDRRPVVREATDRAIAKIMKGRIS